jgi:hypothetical protein
MNTRSGSVQRDLGPLSPKTDEPAESVLSEVWPQRGANGADRADGMRRPGKLTQRRDSDSSPAANLGPLRHSPTVTKVSQTGAPLT